MGEEERGGGKEGEREIETEEIITDFIENLLCAGHLNAFMHIALFNSHRNSERKQTLWEGTQLASNNQDSNPILSDFKVQAANSCLTSLRGVLGLLHKNPWRRENPVSAEPKSLGISPTVLHQQWGKPSSFWGKIRPFRSALKWLILVMVSVPSWHLYK